MRAGWEIKSLADVADLQGRIGWKGLTAKEYQPEGPYFLSVHSLNYGDLVDFRDAFHISQERYDESPEIMLRRDDVLICKDGAGIGKVGIVGEMPGPSTINSSLLLLRAKPNILPKYLYLILQSPYFQSIVQSRLEGATTPHLYQRDIATFPVRLPPLEEQRRIVAVLDEAFAAVALAVRNAERKLACAREFIDSALNRIFIVEAEAWERKRLSEVALDFGRGKSRHRPRGDPKLYGNAAPFIQTGDLANAEHWLREYTQMYSELGVYQSKVWPKGTVCVAIVGATVGESAILDFDACFPDSVIGIVPDRAKADSEYIEYLLQFSKRELKEKGRGTARDNINIGTFEDQLMPFPDVTTQRHVVGRLNAVCDAARELSELTKSELRALAELERSLLHRAFSGELTGRQLAAA